MMKLIVGFLVLCLSVWLGLHVTSDPGYVLISYHDWTVEAPLWVSIGLLLASFLLLYLVFGSVKGLHSMLHAVPSKWRMRTARRAWQRNRQGLMEIACGRWQSAHKNLKSSINNDEMSLVNNIALAYVAWQRGDASACERYLQKVKRLNPDKSMMSVIEGRLCLVNHDWQGALKHFHDALAGDPKQTYVLEQLKCLYIKLGHWQLLLNFLPRLLKYKIIDHAESMLLTRDAYIGLWQTASEHKADPSEMKRLWRQTPRFIQQDSYMMLLYGRYLLSENSLDELERTLRKRIAQSWNPGLIELYAEVDHHAVKQLKFAEKCLNHHADSPELHYAVAKFCLRLELWGKARHHLERCVQDAPKAYQYHITLWQLLNQMHDSQAAQSISRQVLTQQADSMTSAVA